MTLTELFYYGGFLLAGLSVTGFAIAAIVLRLRRRFLLEELDKDYGAVQK